jgi:hypothetical protein
MKPYYKAKPDLSELNEIESYEIKELHSTESKYLKLIANDLKYIKNFISKTEKDEDLLLKWNFAAATLDRLFLIIACLYTFITFLAIIATNKNYYRFN